jgi:hypothetical protein
MERLREGRKESMPVPAVFFRWAGTAAATAIIIAAFWRPERSWVRSDEYFESFDNIPQKILVVDSMKGFLGKEKFRD